MTYHVRQPWSSALRSSAQSLQKPRWVDTLADQIAITIEAVLNLSERRQGLTLMTFGLGSGTVAAILSFSSSWLLAMINAPGIASYLLVCGLFFLMLIGFGVGLLGCGLYAKSKGYPPMACVVAICFTGIFGVAALLLAPDRLAQPPEAPLAPEPTLTLGEPEPVSSLQQHKPQQQPAGFSQHLVWKP